MKLEKLIPLCFRIKTVCRFGDAKIVRLPNGQHQLRGGSDTDKAAAREWASLFAHEIVFAV
ncbi:MAG: hypothetical protein EPO07_10945 [Verrucomicrobia bacterium]|nr:MAG: hypothetical protein EPO07_10945 [Verrucomicrobiota bacterium]